VASNLTRAFCNDLRHREHLIHLLIKKKEVVEETAASHMSMKRRSLQAFRTAELLKAPLFAAALVVTLCPWLIMHRDAVMYSFR
jgi:hypothetical protein